MTRVATVLTVAMLTACSMNPAPRGLRTGAIEAQSNPFGMWIGIDWARSATVNRTAGELLAVDRDSLYVLADRRTVIAVAFADVREGVLMEYDAQWGSLAWWTTGGAVLSPFVNGVLSIFTFPLWLLVGIPATAYTSSAPLNRAPWSWEDLQPFTRFPQGLPADFPRTMGSEGA